MCLLPITRFVNILLVEVGGFAPPSTTTFKQLLRMLSYKNKNHKNYQCDCTRTSIKCKTSNLLFFHTILIWHYRYFPKNQMIKSKVKPPANTFKAPICLSFCSGVQSFFQYLFIQLLYTYFSYLSSNIWQYTVLIEAGKVLYLLQISVVCLLQRQLPLPIYL